MAINLTEKQYLMLSEFAYLDFTNNDAFPYDFKNKTLGDIAEKLLTPDPITLQERVFASHGGLSSEEFRILLGEIANPASSGNPENPTQSDLVLHNLILTDFENDNADTGFVAYAFQATDNRAFKKVEQMQHMCSPINAARTRNRLN